MEEPHEYDILGTPAQCDESANSSSSSARVFSHEGHKATKCDRCFGVTSVVLVCFIGLLAVSSFAFNTAAYLDKIAVRDVSSSSAQIQQTSTTSEEIAIIWRQIEELSSELIAARSRIINATRGMPGTYVRTSPPSAV